MVEPSRSWKRRVRPHRSVNRPFVMPEQLEYSGYVCEGCLEHSSNVLPSVSDRANMERMAAGVLCGLT